MYKKPLPMPNYRIFLFFGYHHIYIEKKLFILKMYIFHKSDWTGLLNGYCVILDENTKYQHIGDTILKT